jgi:hypothetical protein
MDPKLCTYLFSILLVFFLSLLSLIELPSRSKADEATSASNVLGRTVRLGDLCDNFEDADWHYDYQKHKCYREFWRSGADRGGPKLLKRVTTPDGGKKGSTGALEIRTKYNEKDKNPQQDDLLTAEFTQLGRNLTRADQPVFIVRVWLPPFDQWTKGCSFGFRATARSEALKACEGYVPAPDYYPSIWLKYLPSTSDAAGRVDPHPQFFFRVGTVQVDVNGWPIKQPGWWTLALAFDKKGVGHYYARPGVQPPTEKHKMFDTTRFHTTMLDITRSLPECFNNPIMDHMGYCFFVLGYPNDIKITPRFVIDDYEVWVVRQ